MMLELDWANVERAGVQDTVAVGHADIGSLPYPNIHFDCLIAEAGLRHLLMRLIDTHGGDRGAPPGGTSEGCLGRFAWPALPRPWRGRAS
jgi:hypothetical protein